MIPPNRTFLKFKVQRKRSKNRTEPDWTRLRQHYVTCLWLSFGHGDISIEPEGFSSAGITISKHGKPEPCLTARPVISRSCSLCSRAVAPAFESSWAVLFDTALLENGIFFLWLQFPLLAGKIKHLFHVIGRTRSEGPKQRFKKNRTKVNIWVSMTVCIHDLLLWPVCTDTPARVWWKYSQSQWSHYSVLCIDIECAMSFCCDISEFCSSWYLLRASRCT